ncbi:GNAT family N-acetyltransferase [Actinomadura sp. 9N407]|uniref:GNAT family N-acetyltransferase n=1 Tax=Actinomadura sp. 9N407 TaxID=3375154 RepID=UPI0037BA4FA8
MEIRQGGVADVPVVMKMLDGAVAWLADNGRSGQWGERPWSEDSEKVRSITDKVRTGTAWIAEIDGGPAGAMTLSRTVPHYVSAADEPELYITLLVTARSFAGRGVGAALLAHAVAEAGRLGVGLLRVDCYAGEDRQLVAYYRRNGFIEAEAFKVGSWPGQLLYRRI